jgi:hypothetical protein
MTPRVQVKRMCLALEATEERAGRHAAYFDTAPI